MDTVGSTHSSLYPIAEDVFLNNSTDSGAVFVIGSSRDPLSSAGSISPTSTGEKEVTSAMRFIVRRYDSVPTVDQGNGSVQEINSENGGRRYAEVQPKHGDPLDPKLLENGLVGQDEDSNKLSQEARKIGLSLDTLTDCTEATNDVEIGNVVARGRAFAKRQRRRLVCKNGTVNIVKSNISEQRRKFAADMFTTLLDIPWRYIIMLFAAGFVLSWLVFACIWYVIMKAHGDDLHYEEDGYTMCIANVYDFPTALLFSIETQHTIGYGARMVESKCLENIPLLMMQSCLGVFIQALLAGLIFAKLSRPQKRSNTIMFSKNAVICKRDGELCLLLRLGDMRKSHIVGATIRAVMVKNRLTAEGELIPLCSVPLKVEAETMMSDDNFVFLAWPITAVHRINRDSPLWDVSAEQLVSEKFEIVVVLEGTIESTGMTAQLRTSYLPSEILWGHHLSPLVTYQKTDGHYKINYTQFHTCVPIEPSMSECSAKELYEKSLQGDRNNCNNTIESEEAPYPVNFTAPPSSMRQKRTWSLRRGSLKGSVRRKGSVSKPKTPPTNQPPNGMAKFITTPSAASLYNNNNNAQSTHTSLQSVSEISDDTRKRSKGAPSGSASSPERERIMKRSSSSPEHCIAMDAHEIRSADTSDTDVF